MAHREGEKRENILPSRSNECRLGIVRRVPRTHTKFNPSFRIDGQVDFPESPRVVVFFSQILWGNFVPRVTTIIGMSKCRGLYDATAVYLPIRRHLDTFDPTGVTAVRPSLYLD